MRIFVSFVLSPGFFPFLDFRSDHIFVGAGDFLSILSEIERNYLYVRACIVCLFSAALALGALMGMCADAQRVADWTTTGTGRRATRACLSWRTEDDDDDDYHLIHHHHHHDTATSTTTSTSTTMPPQLPLLLQSAAPRGTQDTGRGTGPPGFVYTSAPSDVPASARVFVFVFAFDFAFALFLHALGTCSIPIPICYIYSFRFRRTMHDARFACSRIPPSRLASGF